MRLTPEEGLYTPVRFVEHPLDETIGTVFTSGTRPVPFRASSQNKRDLEHFAERLGMCFRVFPDDVAVLKEAFPDDIPDSLIQNGIDCSFTELQRFGLLSSAKGENGSDCYVVPSEVLLRLERSRAKRENCPRDEYVSKRKKEHAVLAEAFLAAEAPITRRRRYQAEALVQFRKAEAWERLEAMFQASSIHLFGTHDSYVGRACIDIPEKVVRRRPSFAIAITMAEARADVDVNHRGLDDSFEEPSAIPFEEVESRIDRLIKVYGPQWPRQSTIDGKLFLGIHWMRHHRQAGDIAAARDIVERLITLVPEHAAQGDLPAESNLHWFENERAILEFMATNWSAAFRHHKKTIDMTFSSAIPGQYVPRLACSVSAVQHALSGNRREAVSLLHMGTSLLDEHSDQEYIEFTLNLVRLILCMDELDFERGDYLAQKLDERLFRFEIWGVAVRFVQLFDILLDRHSATQARRERTRMSGPGTHQSSPLTTSHVWQAQVDVLQGLGEIQRSRNIYGSRPEVLAGENLGYARLHFLGQRYDRALRLSRSILNGEDVILRDRGVASALIVASYVRLKDVEQAQRALVQCLEISIKAASLLPIALLPKLVRNSVIGLAQTNELWPLLADSVGLEITEMERRFTQVGQCFPEEAVLVDLTPREKVVLKMLDGDHPQAEIARQLHVTLSTIKKQVSSVYRKLGVTSRNEALEIAYKLDLLSGLSLKPLDASAGGGKS